MGPSPPSRLPGAPTLEGEAKAWGAGGSTHQPCRPEQGQARDHGGSLGPPHPRGSGSSGFSGRVWRRLEPPWTLPRDLEEKELQQGVRAGAGGGGESPGIRLQPLGKEAGGSHSTSEPPLPRGVPCLATIADTPTLGTPSGSTLHWQEPAPPRHPRQEPALLYTHPQGLIHRVSAPTSCQPGTGARGIGAHRQGPPCRRRQRTNDDSGCLQSLQMCQVQGAKPAGHGYECNERGSCLWRRLCTHGSSERQRHLWSKSR